MAQHSVYSEASPRTEPNPFEVRLEPSTSGLQFCQAFELVGSKPPMLPEASGPAQATETGDEYRIAVPIGDIDLSDICVLAQPRSILIEHRAPESTVQHAPDAIYSEGNTERALRHVHLDHPIQRGGTALRIVGDSLQIISKKAEAAEEELWSESIDFDTRGSLGCV